MSGSITLAGQLAGTAVSQTYANVGGGAGFNLAATPPLMVTASFGTQGVLFAVGNGSTPVTNVAVTDGLVLMPTEGPDPGGHYCIGGGAIAVSSATGVTTWSLTSLARAGACPSSGPFEGASCVAGSRPTTHLVGQLEGTSFDWMIPAGLDGYGGGSSGAGTSVFDLMEGIGDLGLIELRAAGGDAAAGTVVGSLQLPASVSPKRAVVCIPPASTATMTDHALRFTLRRVTLAGTCGDATSRSSHLDVCQVL